MQHRSGNREAGRHRQRGFTLVEVMMSMTIFLIASMGLLPLLLANMQANRNNTLHGQAQRLAGEIMASLQVHDFDSLYLLDGETLQYGPIEVRKEITSAEPHDDQARLTVTASWRQRDRGHTYQLQSVRSAP